MAEDDVSGRPPGSAVAPAIGPRLPWVALFAMIGAVLFAYDWASERPAQPLATVLLNPAEGMGIFLIACVLGSVLAGRGPFHGLQFPSVLVPFYLADLVPAVASTSGGWEGGWVLGTAGAAAGVAAGAATGWLFHRVILVDTEMPRVRGRAVRMPVAFAVLFAVFGAYNWAIAWLTPDQAWAIGILLIGSALPGALVGKPFQGLLVALPLGVVALVPLVASMTVAWEGGWILGLAGAAAGSAAGAVFGWLFNRWIMPEYDKRRARGSAVQLPG